MTRRAPVAATKTTDDDFASFREFVHFWQAELGLIDWKIYVFHQKPDPGAFATTCTSPVSRAASIRLALSWPDRPVDDNNLKECALHEVMHVVTADLRSEAYARFTLEEDLDVAEHALVIRLTHYISDLHERLAPKP